VFSGPGVGCSSAPAGSPRAIWDFACLAANGSAGLVLIRLSYTVKRPAWNRCRGRLDAISARPDYEALSDDVGRSSTCNDVQPGVLRCSHSSGFQEVDRSSGFSASSPCGCGLRSLDGEKNDQRHGSVRKTSPASWLTACPHLGKSLVWNYSTAKGRPIEYAVGEFRTSQVDTSHTRIIWIYSFKLKSSVFPGRLGRFGRWLFRVSFVDRDYGTLMRSVLQGHKEYAESLPENIAA